MRTYIDENEVHHFTIDNREWLNREKFEDIAEEEIASRLAQTFTTEELRNLVKIDMEKVQERVIEKIADRVVDRCVNDKRFFEREGEE